VDVAGAGSRRRRVREANSAGRARATRRRRDQLGMRVYTRVNVYTIKNRDAFTQLNFRRVGLHEYIWPQDEIRREK